MTDARIQKEPGPDHPITTEPPRPMVVRSGTTVIAETDRTLELQEAGYPPVLYGTDLTAAAWYYDDPFPTVADIERHVVFYVDRVAITTSPSGPTVR